MMQGSKHAVIINAYSYRNAGDAAIMLATAELLSDLGADQVGLSTRYDDETELYGQWGMKVHPPILKFSSSKSAHPAAKLFQFVVSLACTVAALSMPKAILKLGWYRRLICSVQPGLRVITDHDIVAIAGGGYLYTARRRINLSFVHACVSIWASNRLASKVVMMPNSVGPIMRRSDRILIEMCLKDTDVVLRESLSLTRSAHIPKFSKKPAIAPDVAFYGAEKLLAAFPGEEPFKPNLQNSPRVRVVCMDWRWSSSVDPSKYTEYISSLARACDILVTGGYDVVLGAHSRIPEHAQDDIDSCDAVRSMMEEDCEIDRNADVGHLWHEYRRSSVVVGTRLHACIMALSLGTPVVPIAYQEKTPGVLNSVYPHPPVTHWADSLNSEALAASIMSAKLPVGPKPLEIKETLLSHYASS